MNHRQHHADGNDQLLAQLQLHFIEPNNSDNVTQFSDLIYVSQGKQKAHKITQSLSRSSTLH